MNEFGDRPFVDSVEIMHEHNHEVFKAEVDGVDFDSSEYGGDLVKWLQGIADRVHACTLGELDYTPKAGRYRVNMCVEVPATTEDEAHAILERALAGHADILNQHTVKEG